MRQEMTLLSGFGMMLKIGGILFAILGAFASEDRLSLVGVGLIIVLLGYFVNLLDEIFNRTESLPPIDSPSLRSRWKTGFAILFGSGCLFAVAFQPIEAAIDWIARGRSVSSVAAVGLKGLALVVLGPLIFSVFCESQIWARLSAFWLRGFKLGIFAGLVILPWLLLQQAGNLILRLGAIDTDSRMAAGVRLLSMFVSFVVVPFWALPLFRRLSDSPLGRGLVDRAFRRDQDTRPATGMD